MRRLLVLLLPAALAATLIAAPSAVARPNLVVSAAAEPPDFEVAGGRFRHSFTVSNNGDQTARSSAIAAFLSPDPARGDDIRLRGSRRTSSLINSIRARRQRTRRVTLNIASTVAPGFYFLIECADGGNRVRESNERDNCRISGQRVGINASERGQPGPTGPAGPAGPAGRDVDRRRIPRTVVDFGLKTIDGTNAGRPGDDEGSTTLTELARVGPIIIRGLCRHSTNGDGGEPTDPFGAAGSFQEDGDEAKILLYTDSGEFSFQGLHGPRVGIPAGEGTPGDEDAGGGEGKHQFVATMRDPDPNSTGNTRVEWAFGFRSVTGWVAHSSGMDLLISAYAGMDVLDVGDRCVFGGVVTVINAGT